MGYVGHLKTQQQNFSQGDSQTQASKGNEGLVFSNENSYDSGKNSRELNMGQSLRNKHQHGPGTAPATNSRIKPNWHQNPGSFNRTNRMNLNSKGVEEHFPSPKMSMDNKAISIANGQNKICSPLTQQRAGHFKSPTSLVQPTNIAEFLRMK